jgi:hypothetical protein
LCSPWRRISETTIATPKLAKVVDIVDDDESVRSAMLGLMKEAGLPVARLMEEGADGSTTER